MIKIENRFFLVKKYKESIQTSLLSFQIDNYEKSLECPAPSGTYKFYSTAIILEHTQIMFPKFERFFNPPLSS